MANNLDSVIKKTMTQLAACFSRSSWGVVVCGAMLAILDQYSKVIKFSDLPDPSSTWEVQSLVGEGTYGEIHKAIRKESGETHLSRKLMYPHHHFTHAEHLVFKIVRETTLLKRLYLKKKATGNLLNKSC